MKHYTLLILIVVLFMSCDRPECGSTNPIFNEHKPIDQPYQNELAKIIDSAGKDAFDYWIAGYHKNDVAEYLMVHTQNNDVCAIAMLVNPGLEELEHIAFVGGGGYRGAKLSGLNYEIERHGDSVMFVCTAVGKIID